MNENNGDGKKSRRRRPGEGSVFQLENGHWRASIWVDGKRFTAVRKEHDEVVRWMNKVAADAYEGKKPSTSRQTVSNYLMDWVDNKISHLSLSARKSYTHYVQDFIIPELGNIELRKLKSDQINVFYNKLRDDSIGDRTLLYVHQTLHAALQKAIDTDQRLISLNPADFVAIPDYERDEIVILNDEQINQFLAAVDKRANNGRNIAYPTLYRLAITTGLRLSELIGLTWFDIDLKEGKIIIQKQLRSRQDTRTQRIRKPTKTKRGKRTLRIKGKTLEMLRKHKTEQERRAVENYGDSWKENNLVFPALYGTPMSKRNLQRHFAETVKMVGFKPEFAEQLHFHCLRHTAVSILLTKLDVYTVSNLIGHASVSVTMDLYGHLVEGQTERAAEIMDSIVFNYEILN